MRAQRLIAFVAALLLVILTACSSDNKKASSGGGSSTTSTTSGSLSSQELQVIIDRLKAVKQIPRAPEAPTGVNGLANAPTDPTSGDQAEHDFDVFIFDEVVTFWKANENQPVADNLTFQTVDASNNPVPCLSSDKQSGPQNVQADKIGPFYCQDDGTGKPVIYWPLASIFTLPNGTIPSYGAFAEADAIAHEFGHYMQDLGGYLEASHQAAANAIQQGDIRTAAVWSQDIELQADCLAGVWVRNQWDASLLTQDDLNQAGTLTSAVGDDAIDPLRILFPKAGAHGDSEQRVRWLNVGIGSGLPGDCYTWNEPLYGG